MSQFSSKTISPETTPWLIKERLTSDKSDVIHSNIPGTMYAYCWIVPTSCTTRYYVFATVPIATWRRTPVRAFFSWLLSLMSLLFDKICGLLVVYCLEYLFVIIFLYISEYVLFFLIFYNINKEELWGVKGKLKIYTKNAYINLHLFVCCIDFYKLLNF